MKNGLQTDRTSTPVTVESSPGTASGLALTHEGTKRSAPGNGVLKSPHEPKGEGLGAPEYHPGEARHELHFRRGEAGRYQNLHGETSAAGAQGSISPQGNQSRHSLYAQQDPGGTTRLAATLALPGVHAVLVTR